MKQFMIGMFSRHLGTKFLAILLSVILFLFVHEQQQVESTIPQVSLKFRLDKQLVDEYILTRDEVTLQDLRITGKQSDVSRITDAINKSPTREVIITQSFLDTYGKDRTIKLDRNVIRDTAIFGGTVKFSAVSGEKTIEYDELEVVQDVELRLSPDQTDKLNVRRNADYEPTEGDGTKFQVYFNVKLATIRGPKSLFTSGRPTALYVNILPLDPQPPTDGSATSEFEASQPIASIDWNGSGLDSGLLGSATFLVGKGTGVRDVAFTRSLRVLYRVQERAKEVTVTLPILVREPLVEDNADRPRLKGWSMNHQLLDLSDQPKTVSLKLKLPGTLAVQQTFLDSLVLVIDLANASKNLDLWRCNAYLSFRNGERPNDRLARVRFADANARVLVIDLEKEG